MLSSLHHHLYSHEGTHLSTTCFYLQSISLYFYNMFKYAISMLAIAEAADPLRPQGNCTICTLHNYGHPGAATYDGYEWPKPCHEPHGCPLLYFQCGANGSGTCQQDCCDDYDKWAADPKNCPMLKKVLGTADAVCDEGKYCANNPSECTSN